MVLPFCAPDQPGAHHDIGVVFEHGCRAVLDSDMPDCPVGPFHWMFFATEDERETVSPLCPVFDFECDLHKF